MNDLSERIEAAVRSSVRHNPIKDFRALAGIANETGCLKLDKMRVASLGAGNGETHALGELWTIWLL